VTAARAVLDDNLPNAFNGSPAEIERVIKRKGSGRRATSTSSTHPKELRSAYRCFHRLKRDQHADSTEAILRFRGGL